MLKNEINNNYDIKINKDSRYEESRDVNNNNDNNRYKNKILNPINNIDKIN